MSRHIQAALIANTATLGVHWIYNPSFLKALSIKQDLLFMKQSKDIYDASKPSYYVYPKSNVGDFTLQGNILKWLYEKLKTDENIDISDYETLIYQHIKPGGDYEGYIETYTKKMIIERLSKELNHTNPPFDKIDDHLVGFIPFIVYKSLQKNLDQAILLSQTFSHLKAYKDYIHFFNHIIDHIKDTSIDLVILNALHLAPVDKQETLKRAIQTTDTDDFISSDAGIACQINQSIPLIIHLISHATSFEDVIKKNAVIGGASSDRGLLLGFMLSYLFEVPKSWEKYVKID